MQHLKIDDPPAAEDVAAAVAALRAGQLVVLPTETVYGLAAIPESAAVLAAAKGRPPAQPFTHHLSSIDGMDELAIAPPRRVRALLERIWPGPLTLILRARNDGGRGGDGDSDAEIGLRVPAHPFTNRVLAEIGHSVLMTSANPTGEDPHNDPTAIAAAFAGDERIALLADAGPPRLGESSAIIRLRGRHLEVLRQGILDENELLVGAATKILFVCSGNTCRSPLAEGIARKRIAERLSIEVDEVLAHGVVFFSAGTGTLNGMPASAGSVQAAAEVGIDLTRHQSTAIDAGLVRASDRIYCLSSHHAADVMELATAAGVPDAEAKISLLSPTGSSVSDPFGGPVEVYRKTRDEMDAHIRARLDEILELGT